MELIREGNSFVNKDEDGKILAEVTFPEIDGKWVINRTFVDQSLRGQGAAKKLIEKVVEAAKEEDKKIKPSCSYALSFFKKNTQYEDLLDRK